MAERQSWLQPLHEPEDVAFGVAHWIPPACIARALEMIDKVVDARREPIGLDLHSCELRPQRRQAFAEELSAEMLEARILRGGLRSRQPRPGKAPARPTRSPG